MNRIFATVIAVFMAMSAFSNARKGAVPQLPWKTKDYTLVAHDMNLRTALDTFALLHAEGVQTLSLPPSLHYTNAAENFPPKSLRTLAMRQPDGSERVYSGAALPVPLIPGDPSGAEP